jgi:hypothetical protein
MAGELIAGQIKKASMMGGIDAGAIIAAVTGAGPLKVKIEDGLELDQDFLVPSPFSIEIMQNDGTKRASSHYHKTPREEKWKTDKPYEPTNQGALYHVHEILGGLETETQYQKPLEVGDKVFLLPIKNDQRYILLWRDLGGL